MFRSAHPLEVALFWILSGALLSTYAFIKYVPKRSAPLSLDYYEDVRKEIEQPGEIKRDR